MGRGTGGELGVPYRLEYSDARLVLSGGAAPRSTALA